MRKSLVLVLSLLAASCGETATEVQVATMSGRWVGTTAGVTADVTLAETNTQITGSGSLTTPIGNVPVTVTGTNNHPNVSLTLRSTGRPDGNFTGTFTDDNSVTGTITVPGLGSANIVLRRQ